MSLPVAENPQSFASIEEFASRPRYQSQLTIGKDELGQIVGKYELPENRNFWARCGLNGCSTEHRYGFLITNKAGDETNCGHICGRREFGVAWEEVEASYRRRVDAAARQAAVTKLASQRGEMVNSITALLPRVDECSLLMRRFVETFQPKAPFWRALMDLTRLRGVVRVPEDERARGGSGSSAVNLVTVGRIEGIDVLQSSSSDLHAGVLRNKVLPWIGQVLSDEHLRLADDDAIARISAEARTMSDHLRQAQDFCESAERFFAPENLRLLEVVRERILRKSDNTNALKRVVKRWAEGGRS